MIEYGAGHPAVPRRGPVEYLPAEDRAIELLHRRIAELVRPGESPTATSHSVDPATNTSGAMGALIGPVAAPVARPDLVVTVIADETSTAAFGYEWTQVVLTPHDWATTLDERRPALMFVTSAGLADWSDRHLHRLLERCRDRFIPTVFWDNGTDSGADPSIPLLFDVLFTHTAESIAKYLAAGHDRVDVLPVATQPRLHNPVQNQRSRLHEIAYAGEYDPGSGGDLLMALGALGAHMFTDDARCDWPVELAPYLLGGLGDIDDSAIAMQYKVIAILDDSPGQDQRLLNLCAGATPVVRGPGTVADPAFDPLIPTVESAEACFNMVQHLLISPELRSRRGHLAWRAVHNRHLTTHRVDRILTAAGLPLRPRPRSISVLTPTRRPGQVDHILAMVGAQLHRPLQLVLVLHGFEVDPVDVHARARAAGVEDLVVLRADRSVPLGSCLNLGIDAASGDFIAKMDDDDLYGPHYLSDLIRTFDYTDAALTGKGAHYAYFEADNATMLRMPGREHRYVGRVHGGTFLGAADMFRHYRFAPVPSAEDNALLQQVNADGVRIYAADRFNFVYWRGRDASAHTWRPEDHVLLRPARFEFVGRPHEHVLF